MRTSRPRASRVFRSFGLSDFSWAGLGDEVVLVRAGVFHGEEVAGLGGVGDAEDVGDAVDVVRGLGGGASGPDAVAVFGGGGFEEDEVALPDARLEAIFCWSFMIWSRRRSATSGGGVSSMS